jgi:hypothetical protein
VERFRGTWVAAGIGLLVWAACTRRYGLHAVYQGAQEPICGVANVAESARPGYAYLPPGCFVIWVVFLNLAHGRIRELVRAGEDQAPAKSR